MTTAKQSLRESKSMRWIALAIVSFTMLCGYHFEKVTSAIKTALVDTGGWTSTQFGFFRSSYMWLNVFAGMLVIGGIILDKKGVRFTGIMACIVMFVGASTCYYALAGGFHVITQVRLASAGFAIFCMGDEVAGITVSKIIVKWFKGKELALAMGLEMAAARLGTGIALALGPAMAVKWGVPAPIVFGVVLIVIGLLAFLFYTQMDKRLDASEPVVKAENTEQNNEDAFKFSDILQILTNHGFWLIAVLCVLFYSAVFPYLDFASDLMVQKYGIDPKYAGVIPSLLPFGTILLTPIFGTIYDRKGKGASIMALGAILLIIVHTIFSIPAFTHYGYAIFAVLLLGIGFSLVPSAMWPSVPKLIPEKQLGTAYAMIFFIQNIGLGGVPLLIGWVLDRFCMTSAKGAVPITYNYTLPMVIFVSFGVLALIVALMLKATDHKKGYGLELPNIKKS